MKNWPVLLLVLLFIVGMIYLNMSASPPRP